MKIGKGLLNQRTHNPLYIYRKKYNNTNSQNNNPEKSNEEFAEEFDANMTKQNNNDIGKGQKKNK